MSKRLQGRVKKLEEKRKSPEVHLVYVRPDETNEAALANYKKKIKVNPGDKIWIWGGIPIPDDYKEKFY